MAERQEEQQTAATPLALGEGRETTLVHYPAGEPRGELFVLAHGAGAGQRHPFMTGVARGLAARGIDVVTFDFPYMHARRSAPDKASVLEACFRAAIGAGGSSMGCSAIGCSSAASRWGAAWPPTPARRGSAT